jgi:Uracil DNA glycosylase superfamily
MNIGNEKYSHEEIQQIIKGYSYLDHNGTFSNLLKKISICNKCITTYPERSDHPINSLVRPLPLHKLSSKVDIDKYAIRIKRDDTFLRNIFNSSSSYQNVIENIKSAKFTVGLLPWLDRCMLYQKSDDTKLMVIGIDYKHFPVFYHQKEDHNFPLSSYREKNYIWGPSWKSFWSKLLNVKYDDDRVNEFIAEEGVYFTNSMLCFGGSQSATHHYFKYLECCREYIEKQIEIVRPEIIVSFGNFGCRNVASILLSQNTDNDILKTLSILSQSFKKSVNSLLSHPEMKNGIKAKYNSETVTFWPLYQPARNQRFDDDYKILRRLVGFK